MSMESDDSDEQEPATATRKGFLVSLDPEDRALLEQLAAIEKLKKADILRRALRRYAKDFGLTNTPTPSPGA